MSKEKEISPKWVLKAKDENTVILKLPYKLKKDYREIDIESAHILDIIDELVAKFDVEKLHVCAWLCGALFVRDPHRLGYIINVAHAREYLEKLNEVSELVKLKEVM